MGFVKDCTDSVRKIGMSYNEGLGHVYFLVFLSLFFLYCTNVYAIQVFQTLIYAFPKMSLKEKKNCIVFK